MRDSTRYEKVEEAPGFADSGLFGPYKFIRLKSGREMTIMDAIRDVEGAYSSWGRGMSRAFKLANSDFDIRMIEYRLSQMEEHCAALRQYRSKLEEEKVLREKIAALRNTEGRTPEEAAAYLRKADELEKGLA